jgi:hypothetical protein
MLNDIGVMKEMAKQIHKELLELIQSLSDTNTSSDGSSVCTQFTTHTPD